MPSLPPRPTTPRLDILFEDDDVLVAVKPAGLPTAHAPAGALSLFRLVQSHLPQGAFVGVVSRLDSPVSGLVVMAKTRRAAAHLSRQFRDRTVRKSYLAICEGRFPAPLQHWVDWHDTVEHATPFGADREAAGRPAHVRARVMLRSGEVSLVELEPSSGRRHQLRIQLGSRGCPIVGDRTYGSRLPFPDGIALHARALAFDHPVKDDRMHFETRPPDVWKTRYPLLLAPARE